MSRLGSVLFETACYNGFIAWISDTTTGPFASDAAATIVSTKAMHSAFPVASNSRNDRTRDMDQSMAATADAGERSISFFVLG